MELGVEGVGGRSLKPILLQLPWLPAAMVTMLQIQAFPP